MALNLVVVSRPLAVNSPWLTNQPCTPFYLIYNYLTSALNSTNSSPRQSNSRMFCVFAGSVRGYVAGAAFTFAECSLYYCQSACVGQFGYNIIALQYSSCISRQKLLRPYCRSSRLCPMRSQTRSSVLLGGRRTKRFTVTQFGCISRHDVHWTLNV
jgi:hypothetical protein